MHLSYSISYCQEHGNCDPGKDPLDKLVERVKINTDNNINKSFHLFSQKL